MAVMADPRADAISDLAALSRRLLTRAQLLAKRAETLTGEGRKAVEDEARELAEDAGRVALAVKRLTSN